MLSPSQLLVYIMYSMIHTNTHTLVFLTDFHVMAMYSMKISCFSPKLQGVTLCKPHFHFFFSLQMLYQ